MLHDKVQKRPCGVCVCGGGVLDRRDVLDLMHGRGRMTIDPPLASLQCRGGACRVFTGGGRTRLLLALVIWPLTTHPFRDGVPFLLLIETPPTVRRPLRCFHILHGNFLLILSPSCFAACGRHLSPRVTICFSLLSGAPHSAMSHPSISLFPLSPLLTHPNPPCTFHILLRTRM